MVAAANFVAGQRGSSEAFETFGWGPEARSPSESSPTNLLRSGISDNVSYGVALSSETCLTSSLSFLFFFFFRQHLIRMD